MSIDISIELIGFLANCEERYGVMDGEDDSNFSQLNYLDLIKRLRGRDLSYIQKELACAEEKGWLHLAKNLDSLDLDSPSYREEAVRNYLNVCKELKMELEKGLDGVLFSS